MCQWSKSCTAMASQGPDNPGKGNRKLYLSIECLTPGRSSQLMWASGGSWRLVWPGSGDRTLCTQLMPAYFPLWPLDQPIPCPNSLPNCPWVIWDTPQPLIYQGERFSGLLLPVCIFQAFALMVVSHKMAEWLPRLGTYGGKLWDFPLYGQDRIGLYCIQGTKIMTSFLSATTVETISALFRGKQQLKRMFCFCISVFSLAEQGHADLCFLWTIFISMK